MSYRNILHLLGGLLVAVAIAMIPAAGVGFVEGLGPAWLLGMAIPGLTGLVLWFATPRSGELNAREALTIVGLAWIAIVLAGAIPFLTTNVAPDVAGAVFESVSGFTTTGATIYPVIEELPDSILLWRSLSHWIGGMGIIVLGVAILPLLGVGGAQLFFAEAPGITTDRIRPRIATTARLLWGVYVGLTAVLIVAYLLLGMSPFDAVNHAMSALATGGFSTRTASMGYYSAPIQWVTIIFMFFAGVNFTLHYRALTGRPLALLRNAEFKWYLLSCVLFSAACFVVLGYTYGTWTLEVARDSIFSVVSIHSTTGFGTADFATWPVLLQSFLLALMFVGGMGGSTGGGFKMIRGAVVAQHVFGEIRKVLHPRAVIVTRVGGQPIRSDLVLKVLAFLAMYMGTHAIGTAVLAALGSDLVTALSASLAALSSIGPGLGEVGPAGNYSGMSSAALVVLSVLMLLGRLEFYTLLVLLIPSTWTRGHRTPRPKLTAVRRKFRGWKGEADPLSSWPPFRE
ncbi:MAG: TrkH family potassium uptake protein [marine benthic group bacterium]|nr:TrkH family potassium uptake protein [Gemmatimonadota bacterium]MCL7962842.1 TrkH family potassium uptake protein [Candidatus Carthagonibacter metallireducens]MCL7938209.1 TrkH family potassium uptake protein [Gemmatimonadota bacterium]MCL7956873.1 TrkH family potassium uptake protein [Gemmatimonadota bacterium]MCL7964651.1 TrkH family potassium uptake protein [Gemmatimonadota bacterium]